MGELQRAGMVCDGKMIQALVFGRFVILLYQGYRGQDRSVGYV